MDQFIFYPLGDAVLLIFVYIFENNRNAKLCISWPSTYNFSLILDLNITKYGLGWADIVTKIWRIDHFIRNVKILKYVSYISF